MSPWERDVRFYRHWNRDTYDPILELRKWRRRALFGWFFLIVLSLVEFLRK